MDSLGGLDGLIGLLGALVEGTESYVQFYELDRGVRFDILITLLAHGMTPF
jgi:hypothetical protein